MAKSKITMQKIADMLDISKVTVSKALNGKEGVGPELKKKIIEKAIEYGYKAPKSGNNNIGEGHHIAVFCADKFLENADDSNFYPNIYQKISIELAKRNNIGTLISVNKKENYEDTERLLNLHRFDGIIALGRLEEEFLNTLRKTGLPRVYVDTDDDYSDTPTVLIENIYSVCSLTEYLVTMGHKDIGFIGSVKVTKSIMDRYLGFLRTMMLNGLEVKKEWIIEDRTPDNEKIEISFPEIFPTAFVCNCDDTAYRVVKGLQEKGLRVPEDISIVSFDNDIFSKLSEPQLTTIAPDINYIAKKAAEIIIKQIKEPEKNVAGPILVNGKIIYRESVKKLL